MSADKPDPIFYQRRVHHVANLDERLQLSIGYICTLAFEPNRWQRFKAWVSRLFGRGS